MRPMINYKPTMIETWRKHALTTLPKYRSIVSTTQWMNSRIPSSFCIQKSIKLQTNLLCQKECSLGHKTTPPNGLTVTVQRQMHQTKHMPPTVAVVSE